MEENSEGKETEEVGIEEAFLLEKAELMQGFMEEEKRLEFAHREEINELVRELEREKEKMKQAFEYEKQELRKNFDNEKDKIRREFQGEKHVLKQVFEDDRFTLIRQHEEEISGMKQAFEQEKEEIREGFEQQMKGREEVFLLEKRNLEERLNVEIDRVAEIEGELKQILLTAFSQLGELYETEGARIALEVATEQPEADQAGKTTPVKKSERRRSRKNSEIRVINEERTEMGNILTKCRAAIEREFSLEMYEMEQRFRQQKSDLMEIFKLEKRDLERKTKREKREMEREFETRYAKQIQQERLKFDAAIQGYENDIALLKYQKERLEIEFGMEMEKLKLRHERQKVEVEKTVLREKRELKQLLETEYKVNLAQEKGRLEWFVRKLQGKQEFGQSNSIFRET
jgi:hypothetical protein